MPQITNTQAIAFANTRIRPFADDLYALYLKAKAIQREWYSQNLGAVLPNTTDQVMDGADTDGRPIIQGQDVNNVVNRVNELIAWLETGTTSGTTVTNATLNTIAKVQVNGGNR